MADLSHTLLLIKPSCPHDKHRKSHWEKEEREEETNDIDDRIKKIKCQLDRLSDLSSDDLELDSGSLDHIRSLECVEVSEEEEAGVNIWDLCDVRRKNTKGCGCQRHPFLVGEEFMINEDLNVLKNKVMHKSDVIISCYKKKLLECEENKCSVQKLLEKYKEKNFRLKEKLNKYSESLARCEADKKKIMSGAKKCEKEIKELKGGCLLKNKIKCQVDNLDLSLDLCKKNKGTIIKNISCVESKMKRCDKINIKLECVVQGLAQEICKLNKKVSLLIQQNEQLAKENINLKEHLAKTLKTLKWLCDKYNALRRKRPL